MASLNAPPPARRQRKHPMLDRQRAQAAAGKAPGLAAVAPAPDGQSENGGRPEAVRETSADASPRQRESASAREQLTFTGARHNAQVQVPRALHDRYDRLRFMLEDEGHEVLQQEWIGALLLEGPQTPSEIRDLVEARSEAVRQAFAHEKVKSTVNGMIPAELWKRLDRCTKLLKLDERFVTSPTEVIKCLMFDGPQTTSELLELVERYRQVVPRRG